MRRCSCASVIVPAEGSEHELTGWRMPGSGEDEGGCIGVFYLV